jgi:hypothetical protein
MKLEKVKKTKTKVPSGRNLFKKIVAVLLSIAVFCGAYYVISEAGRITRETEDVVRIKAPDGIPERSVITLTNVEKYTIVQKELKPDMVLYKDLNDVLEKYTTNYLRNEAILHYDEVSIENTRKNEWTYPTNNGTIPAHMPLIAVDLAGKEILTIPYNYLESGGDILTPGDSVRIRVRYEMEEMIYEEGYEEDGNYYKRPAGVVTKEETATLFDSIVVTDMLNSKGHSIYEVYREVLRYPDSERQRLLKSKDFIGSIVPKTLVVVVSAEEAKDYMQYIASKKAMMITILPRNEDTIILDMTPALKAEVGVWLENQKK